MSCGSVYLAVAVCFCAIASVDPTSFTSKARQRAYMVHSIRYGRTDDIYAKSCEDDYSDCYKYVNYCHKSKILRTKCAETCFTCRPDTPPLDCKLTKYGCCWDNNTAAAGPNFRGCKPCVDEYPECSYYKNRCHGPGTERIRLACPVTCNVGCQNKQCLDDKHQAKVCKLYKRFGFCKASPELMGKLCAKTCGFCL